MTTPNAPNHAPNHDANRGPNDATPAAGPDARDVSGVPAGRRGSAPAPPPVTATGRDATPDLVPDLAAPTPGESLDESDLRSLMRNAVEGIEGSPDALAHLRRAIPARRQHRRQAVGGAVAAVLLAGMAIPALLRATGTSDSAGPAPQNVASSHAADPDEDGHAAPWSGQGTPSGQAPEQPGAVPVPTRTPVGAGGTSAVTASPTDSRPAPGVPDCTGSQLGHGAAQAGSPDADGRVYGWFRVANVSDATCEVLGGGVIEAVAEGSADPRRIQVLAHSPGDRAPDLPFTSFNSPVVLQPGEDYEVDFAWVPASDGPGGCPAPTTPPPTSATPTATPTDTASPGTADPGTDAGSATTDTGTGGESGAPSSPPPGSVLLKHTPAADAPVITGPVIPDACAGTVYTTSAMAAPAGAARP
jgi:hypothetical protein